MRLNVLVSLAAALCGARAQPEQGRGFLPSRQQVEELGLRFLDAFLKAGQAELAKTVYRSQAERFGLADAKQVSVVSEVRV